MQHGAMVAWLAAVVLVPLAVGGCQDRGRVSENQAREHAASLAETVAADVEEIRKGLPLGAAHAELIKLFSKDGPREEKAEAARGALEDARDDVQDLRVCKATFFAVAGTDGIVIRTDQEVDRMAGKSLFGPFGELAQVASGRSVETRGEMEEASGVKGKPDGQWIAAQPVKVGEEVKGIYAAGWTWSKYAYRLEFKLRNDLMAGLGEYGKMPLVYVFVVVSQTVYGAPVSPLVTQEELAKLDLIGKLQGDGAYATQLELTGRGYGLAVKATPVLGPSAAVVVLRSET